ncbi:hypothetical protein A4R26_22285 [Niastella populi]|uniref:Uncharacterized protein n=1 Tax=Niastella populi TaxID=550983 RepID=A0A1V9FKV3_9BACT|nr:hypothetical protein A4R26_22285 [Niastella populi]
MLVQNKNFICYASLYSYTYRQYPSRSVENDTSFWEIYLHFPAVKYNGVTAARLQKKYSLVFTAKHLNVFSLQYYRKSLTITILGRIDFGSSVQELIFASSGVP